MAKKLASMYLDTEQLERLDKLSAKTRVPSAVKPVTVTSVTMDAVEPVPIWP